MNSNKDLPTITVAAEVTEARLERLKFACLEKKKTSAGRWATSRSASTTATRRRLEFVEERSAAREAEAIAAIAATNALRVLAALLGKRTFRTRGARAGGRRGGRRRNDAARITATRTRRMRQIPYPRLQQKCLEKEVRQEEGQAREREVGRKGAEAADHLRPALEQRHQRRLPARRS